MKKYYIGNKDIQKEKNESLKEYLKYSNDPIGYERKKLQKEREKKLKESNDR